MVDEVKKDNVEQKSAANKDALDIIVLEPQSPVLAEIIKDKLASAHNIVNASNAAEASMLSDELGKCIIYVSIVDRKAVEAACQLLLKLKQKIKLKQVKVVVLTKVINPQLRTMIAKLGITDYIEEPINARSLFFKINLQLKALKTQIEKERKELEDSKKQLVFKNTKDVKDETAIEFKKKPAVKVGKDAFVFSGQAPQKKDNKYIVAYDGPSPIEGEWKKDEQPGSNGQARWKWKPAQESKKSTKADEEEETVFEGDKPQFNQATGQWQLKGEKPELSIEKKKQKLASKLTTSAEGELEIAEETPEAVEQAVAVRSKHLANKHKESTLNIHEGKEQTAVDAKNQITTDNSEDEVDGKSPNSISSAKISNGAARLKELKNKNINSTTDENSTEEVLDSDTVEEESQSVLNNKAGKTENKSDRPLELKTLETTELKKGAEPNQLKQRKTKIEEINSSDKSLDPEGKTAPINNKISSVEAKQATNIHDGSEQENQLKSKKENPTIGANEVQAVNARQENEKKSADTQTAKLSLKEIKSQEVQLQEKMKKATTELEKAEITVKLKQMEARRKRLERGQKVLEKIKALAKEPLKTDLTPEEVTALEKELKVAPQSHSVLGLAKKKRKKDLETLQKEYLDDLNSDPGATAPETNIHDLGPGRADYISTELKSGEERKLSDINAYDSVEKPAEDGKDIALAKLENAFGKKDKKSGSIGSNEKVEDGAPVSATGEDAGSVEAKKSKKDKALTASGGESSTADSDTNSDHNPPELVAGKKKSAEAIMDEKAEEKIESDEDLAATNFNDERKKNKQVQSESDSGGALSVAAVRPRNSENEADVTSEKASKETGDDIIKQKATVEQEQAREALNDRLEKRMKDASPALTEFLKKRKNADQVLTPDAKIVKKVEARFEHVTDPEKALLGFKMALSDALHLSKSKIDPENSTRKILQQAVVGIGFCSITVLRPLADGAAFVYASSDTAFKSGDSINVAEYEQKAAELNCLLSKIKSKDESSVVGYMLVSAVHKRDLFTALEAKTLIRMIELFAPYWENVCSKTMNEEIRKAG